MPIFLFKIHAHFAWPTTKLDLVLLYPYLCLLDIWLLYLPQSGYQHIAMVATDGAGGAARSEEVRKVMAQHKGISLIFYNRVLRENAALQGKVVVKLR